MKSYIIGALCFTLGYVVAPMGVRGQEKADQTELSVGELSGPLRISSSSALTATNTLRMYQGQYQSVEFPASSWEKPLGGKRMILVSPELEDWRGYNICYRSPLAETCVDAASVFSWSH